MRALVLVSLTLAIAGCSAEKKALKATARSEAGLMQASSTYWEAVRWNDFGTASNFLESQDERLTWMTEAATGTDYRYQSAVVLRAEVGTESEEPDSEGVIREGSVVVQIQGYKLPQQLLEQKVEVQRWYRTESAWFIRLD